MQMQAITIWSTIHRSLDRTAKRILDTTIALVLLFLLFPVFLVVGIMIWCNSPGPLLYRQKRVGKDGRIFEIYKFRTMQINADQQGPSVTAANDSRVTPIGRWLRDKKIDEIPQLLNVINGEMSLVGPRPQVPKFVDHFDPTLRAIALSVRPGITGPTALRFRYEEKLLANKSNREDYYIHKILPIKLEMDARYVQTRSFSDDFRILIETALLFSTKPIKRILCGKGQYFEIRYEEILEA